MLIVHNQRTRHAPASSQGRTGRRSGTSPPASAEHQATTVPGSPPLSYCTRGATASCSATRATHDGWRALAPFSTPRTRACRPAAARRIGSYYPAAALRTLGVPPRTKARGRTLRAACSVSSGRGGAGRNPFFWFC